MYIPTEWMFGMIWKTRLDCNHLPKAVSFHFKSPPAWYKQFPQYVRTLHFLPFLLFLWKKRKRQETKCCSMQQQNCSKIVLRESEFLREQTNKKRTLSPFRWNLLSVFKLLSSRIQSSKPWNLKGEEFNAILYLFITKFTSSNLWNNGN